MLETWVRSLAREDLLEKKAKTHSICLKKIYLPGKSHGQRSLAGYPTWGRQSWTRLSDYTTTTKLCAAITRHT